MANRVDPYDALLLVSFGGPENPDEVMPFLRRVTGGRDIPQERLDEVAQHYLDRGGKSPLNDECRALLTALEAELKSRGIDIPMYWGNRNAAPLLDDTMRQIVTDGLHRVLVVTTSAYPSYSSCRQYRENLYDAAAPLMADQGDLQVDRIRHFGHHPGFVAANTEAVLEALRAIPSSRPLGVRPTPPRVVFVTHSIPREMAATSGPPPWSQQGSYVDWHRVVAAEVATNVQRAAGKPVEWDLAYCSRSGRPDQEWLEPDVNDHLERLAAEGVSAVVLAPIGFIFDHMEVVQDLDEEAVATARRLGMTVVRAATARTHPRFVRGLADLILERAALARGERVLPSVIHHGSPGRSSCPVDCCPNPFQPGRPSACEDASGLPQRDPRQPSQFRSGSVWRS